jgi:hypothetical protein
LRAGWPRRARLPRELRARRRPVRRAGRLLHRVLLRPAGRARLRGERRGCGRGRLRGRRRALRSTRRGLLRGDGVRRGRRRPNGVRRRFSRKLSPNLSAAALH